MRRGLLQLNRQRPVWHRTLAMLMVFMMVFSLLPAPITASDSVETVKQEKTTEVLNVNADAKSKETKTETETTKPESQANAEAAENQSETKAAEEQSEPATEGQTVTSEAQSESATEEQTATTEAQSESTTEEQTAASEGQSELTTEMQAATTGAQSEPMTEGQTIAMEEQSESVTEEQTATTEEQSELATEEQTVVSEGQSEPTTEIQIEMTEEQSESETEAADEIEFIEDGLMLFSAMSSGDLTSGNLTSGNLTVTKVAQKVMDDGTVVGNVDAAKKWTFTVTLKKDGSTDTDVDGIHGEMDFKEGVATFELGNGESKSASGLPAGDKYDVKEDKADKDGYKTTWSDTGGNANDANITCTNTIDMSSGNLTIEKKVNGGAATTEDQTKAFTFTVTLNPPYDKEYTVADKNGGTETVTFKDGKGTITVNGGSSKTIQGIPTGKDDFQTKYTVTEDEANTNGFITSIQKGEGFIVYNDTVAVECTNSKPKTKKTEEVPGADVGVKVGDEITYKISYENPGPDNMERIIITDKLDSGVDYVPTSDGGTYDASTHTVTWTLNNVAPGSGEVTLTVRVNSKAVIQVENKASVNYNNKATVETTSVKNPVKTGKLKVSKTVTKSPYIGTVDANKKWQFKVTLKESESGPVAESINGTYGSMKFEKGVATFELGDKDSVEAENLPAGITYVVEETGANQGGYTTSWEGDTSGTIPADSTAEVTCTNTIDMTSGNLTIQKKLSGEGISSVDESKTFTFNVTLEPKYSGTYGGVEFKDGVGIVTLTGEDSKTLTGIPTGMGEAFQTTYTITEKKTSPDEYITFVDNNGSPVGANEVSGRITPKGNGEVHVTFTNSKPKPHKTSNPASGISVKVGQEITYTIDYENLKNVPATIKIRDTLDKGLTIKTGSITDGGVWTAPVDADVNGGTVNWTLENVSAGGKGSVTFVATVNEKALKDKKVTNTAEVDFGNGYIQTETVEHPVPTGGLKVSKTVTGSAGDKQKEWHFHVALSDTSVTGEYGGMTFTNGATDFTLKDGQSKEADGLPAGITYTVNESEANQDNYTTTPEGGATGQIPEDNIAEAAFENYLPGFEDMTSGDLTIAKEVYGNDVEPDKEFQFTVELKPPYSGTFGGVTFTDGKADVTVKGGESKTITDIPTDIPNDGKGHYKKDGVRTDTTYTITETGANDYAASFKPSNTGTVKKDTPVTVTCENSRTKPHKEETAPGAGVNVEVGQEVTYEITCENPTDQPMDITVTDALDQGLTFASASMDGLTLQAEDISPVSDGAGNTIAFENGIVTWTLKNVPAYSTEAEHKAKKVTLKVKVNKQAVQKGKVANTAHVKYGNTWDKDTNTIENPVKTGGLIVSKTVAPGSYQGTIDKDKKWNFKVTLKENGAVAESIDGTYGDMTFTKGAAEFTLSDGEFKSATGLPVGTAYEVVETDANQGGYTTSWSGASGTIPENNTAAAEAKCTNTVEMSTGGLDVTKVVNGEGAGQADLEKEFHFTVTLTPPYSGTYGGVEFKNGVGSFTLKSGETRNLTGIPTGIVENFQTKYKVTEEEADKDGFLTFVEHGSGVITAGGSSAVTVRFTNSKPEPHKTSDPASGTSVLVGQDIKYTITYKNIKDAAATIKIMDPLDRGLTIRQDTISDGGVWTAPADADVDGGTINWTLENVPAGKEGFVTFVATVNERALKNTGQKVVNTSYVDFGNGYVQTETVEHPVKERPEVIIEKEQSLNTGARTKNRLTAQAFDVVTYYLIVKNISSTDATDVVVTDAIPNGLTLKKGNDAISDGGTLAGGVITWHLGTLAANASRTVTFKVVTPRVKEYTLWKNMGSLNYKENNGPPKDSNVVEVEEEPVDESETGSVTVTKKLTYSGSPLAAKDAVFYVALYADEECTVRATDLAALEYKNSSSESVTFTGLDLGKTYYVGESDAQGNVFLSGMVSDGTLFMATFNHGSSAKLETAGEAKVVEFENVFFGIPSNYMREGTLTVTKRVLGADGQPKAGNETFYAGIFADEAHTMLSDSVSENIVTLPMEGGSQTSASVNVYFADNEMVKLYVTEVTSEGAPVGNDFGYIVTVTDGEAEFSAQDIESTVTITNQQPEEPGTEEPTEELTEKPTEKSAEKPKESSEKTTEAKAVAAKTGDDTPIMLYVFLLAMAACAIVVAGSRKKRAGKSGSR